MPSPLSKSTIKSAHRSKRQKTEHIGTKSMSPKSPIKVALTYIDELKVVDMRCKKTFIYNGEKYEMLYHLFISLKENNQPSISSSVSVNAKSDEIPKLKFWWHIEDSKVGIYQSRDLHDTRADNERMFNELKPKIMSFMTSPAFQASLQDNIYSNRKLTAAMPFIKSKTHYTLDVNNDFFAKHLFAIPSFDSTRY